MTHIESLLTKIMTINYTALCKIQLVLKQTTTVQPAPLPFPEPPKRRKTTVMLPLEDLLIQTTKQLETVVFGAKEAITEGETRASAIGPDDPWSTSTAAKCPAGA